MKRKRRDFTPEFKAEAVSLVLNQGVSISQVAKDFDPTESALRLWVKAAGEGAATRNRWDEVATLLRNAEVARGSLRSRGPQGPSSPRRQASPAADSSRNNKALDPRFAPACRLLGREGAFPPTSSTFGTSGDLSGNTRDEVASSSRNAVAICSATNNHALSELPVGRLRKSET